MTWYQPVGILSDYNEMPFGFSISFKINVYEYNKKIKNGNMLSLKKIFVALAGPLINLLLMFIIFYLNINENMKLQMIYANLILAVFNLLPVYPLDGGRILKELFKECPLNRHSLYL